MGELRGFDSVDIAYRSGQLLTDLAKGRIREIRAASTHPIGVNDTLEPDSMGEKSPTYDGRGSELVAHEMYRGILNVINYESIAARLATWLQVGTNGMYVPLGDDIQDADWYEENCEILPIKPGTKRATLDLKKMGARVQVSNELMDDAYVSVAQIVTRTIGNAFAHKLDKTLIQGDAKIGFGGLAPAIGAGQTITTAAAGKVTIDEVASVIGKVDPMARNRVWLVSDEGWTKVMGLAAGAIGVNVTQGVTQTIFGSPVIKTSLLPAKTYAIYGDFSMAAAIGYKHGLTIRSSSERAIEYDQTVFVGTARYAFAVLAAKYLAALKSA
jgi:HK97 family phage major capsid protein